MKMLKLIIFVCSVIVSLHGVHAQTDCTDIDPIDVVDIIQIGLQLVVVWQEPENMEACGFQNIMHTVTYTGHESVQELVTSNFYVYFDYYPYRCVPSVISITAYNNDVYTSVTVEYYTETSRVIDLAVTQDDDGIVVASWSPPENSEFCNFVYLVTYEDTNSNEATVETTDLQASLDGITLSSCIIATVLVRPINGEYAGFASAAQYEGDINPVRNYALSEASAEVIAQFDPPLDIEFCNMTYEVRKTEEDCYQIVVSVAAFNGRIYSPWVSDIIEVPIERLSDLSVSIGDATVDISWSAPSDADACLITYRVVYDGDIYSISDSSLTLEVDVQACVATTVSVSAVSSSGLVGAASEVQIQGDLGAIENLLLTVEDSAVVATWNAPPNSLSCTLTYLLEYADANGTHIFVTADNTYTFEYAAACVDIRLSIVPYGKDGSEGTKATTVLPTVC